MTYTGRTAERLHRGSKLCAGCNQRVMVGDPRPSSTWPGRLHLSREEYELLLIAAAEYAELTDEAGEYESAVAFLDWCSVDALRPPGHRDIPEADGAPPRNNAGGLASAYQSEAHRHPDPIPVVSVRVWRRQAG